MKLEGDQGRLYDLIWKRAMASQMASARMERTTVDFSDGTGMIGLLEAVLADVASIPAVEPPAPIIEPMRDEAFISAPTMDFGSR